MRVGVLYSRVRVEEKLLFEELERRGVAYDLLDDRELLLEITNEPAAAEKYRAYDVILERCINHSRAAATLRILNDWGIPTVNTFEVAEVCGSKLYTSSALAAAGVPQPRTLVAYTPESALEAIERHGLPGGAQARGRLVGPAAVEGQRSRRRRGAARAQGDAGQLPPQRLLHPGVRREADARHPQLRGRDRRRSARSTATRSTGSPTPRAGPPAPTAR